MRLSAGLACKKSGFDSQDAQWASSNVGACMETLAWIKYGIVSEMGSGVKISAKTPVWIREKLVCCGDPWTDKPKGEQQLFYCQFLV